MQEAKETERSPAETSFPFRNWICVPVCHVLALLPKKTPGFERSSAGTWCQFWGSRAFRSVILFIISVWVMKCFIWTWTFEFSLKLPAVNGLILVIKYRYLLYINNLIVIISVKSWTVLIMVNVKIVIVMKTCTISVLELKLIGVHCLYNLFPWHVSVAVLESSCGLCLVHNRLI